MIDTGGGLVFRVETDPGGTRTLSVEQWPARWLIDARALHALDPEVYQLEGDRLTVRASNGSATYQARLGETDAKGYIPMVKVDE